MQRESPYRLGVIEGYFGRQWSWQARRAYADFLAGAGFNCYIYAPKNDDFLRKRWREPFPDAHLDELAGLAAACRERNIEFGIGLSPVELYRDFSLSSRRRLRDKLAAIDALMPDTVCLLFDDMHGDLDGLAGAQVEIMDFVITHSGAERFMLCPTYYSSDPRLARLFGSPPEHYLDELGQLLHPAIDVFWTGPEVVSRRYPPAHLAEVAGRLRRKPTLWDNYPVNDARALVSFLHLLPFKDRGPELREYCNGHLANPMNQPWLSRLPLATLPAAYAGRDDLETLFRETCERLCPPALAEALVQDAAQFQHGGLEALTAAGKTALLERYAAFGDDPMAREVLAWLRGEYAFDPACLT